MLDIDAADVGARVQLGQIRLAQRQFREAVTLFEEALAREPFNATAAYGMSQALARSGDRPRAEEATARFQQLRDNPAAITYSATYLEQGRHVRPSAAVLDSLPPLLKLDGSKYGGPVRLIGIDAQGHVVQKNSRGELFYLNPANGDMVFVK